MFNQFKAASETRGGRLPKPTLKVRRLLADSIATDLKKLSGDLNQIEGEIRNAMQQHLLASKVHGIYSRWCDVCEEFEQTETMFRTHLDSNELAVHDRILESKRHLFDQLKEDVSDYLANAARKSSHVASPKSFLEETRRLEREIQVISARLNQAQLSIAGKESTSITSREELDHGCSDEDIGTPRFKSTPASLFGDGEPLKGPAPFCHPLVDEDPALRWQATSVAGARLAPRNRIPVQDQTDTGTLQKLVTLMEKRKDRLPQLEPETFDGAMLQYPLWIKSFELLIEKNTSSVSERLFYLGKYTSGEARESIAGFLCLFSEDAYSRAKSVLQSRYGDRVQVAQAYKQKLASWSAIKKGDGLALRRLADFTWQCSAAMETVKNLRSLDSAESVSKIVRLLPQYLMERWDRVVDKHYYSNYNDPRYSFETTEGDYPPFVEFCKFLSQEARILNGPGRMLRGEVAETGGSGSSSQGKNKRVQAFATKTNEDKPSRPRSKALSCYFCSEPHVISKCEQFLKQGAEEKRQFATAESLCFGCLSKTHAYKECRTKKPWLLKDEVGEKKKTVLSTRLETDGEDGVYYTLLVPVEVTHPSNPTKKVKCYALLDTQADGCFVSTALANRLQVPENAVQLELVTMGDRQIVSTSLVSQLKVKGIQESKVVTIKKAYTRQEIPSSSQSIPNVDELRRWPHLKHVVNAFPEDSEDLTVEMLIGCNYPGVFVPHDCAYESDDKPYGVRTKLGWGIMGRRDGGCKVTQCFKTSLKEVPMAVVTRAFDFEFQGNAEDRKRASQEDLAFLEMAKRSLTQCSDGHFEMELPIRDETVLLPNNRDVALRQLLGQKKRFLRDVDYLQQYNTCMQEMLSKGYAEVAPEEYEQGKVSFTPHHAVSHPRKPGVLRVVSNFSSQKHGVSLNQNLMGGPDLTGNLVGVMCRFREEKVAFMCDIKQMFHQVRVAAKHRDYLRFLWYEGGDPEGKVIEYRMCVFPFGATSSPSCANYAFKATATKYGDRFDPEVAQFVQRDFYVDDGLKSKATVSEVVRLFLQAHELCKLGRFYLCKFTCNAAEAVKAVPKELLATSVRESMIAESMLPIETSLGLKWDMNRDCFMFVIKQIVRQLTRRGLLSTLASIYDPIGLIAPIVLVGRLILQELCRQGAEWDEELPPDIAASWSAWFSGLEEISSLKIDRCFRGENQGDITEVQVHHFCDASTLGYGCCSYVRLKDESGSVAVSLATAKAKVGPKKAVTMPRLELQAAVLVTKQALFLREELPYDQVEHHFWSDSQVVLGYVTNFTRKFHLYVANRVAYIREHSKAADWRYVRTEQNPADLASRGATVAELRESEIWWHGPEFLRSEEWREKMDSFNVDENDPEVKRERVVVKATATKRIYSAVTCLSSLSDWNKMISCVAVWRHYLWRLHEKASLRCQSISSWPAESASVVQHRLMAEKALWKMMQGEVFIDELRLFQLLARRHDSREDEKESKLILKQTSSLYRLDPFIDEEGLLRVGGRLKYSPLPAELTRPIIVPDKHVLVAAMIRYYHQAAQHPGRQATLAQIRGAGLWLIHGRGAVEKATRDCVVCKRVRGTPVVQKIADLPEERLQEVPPFTYCGMDLFGPFQIRERRSSLKRWICVFICFNSLAVHLEVVYEISTDSFLNAFRRFVGRRGAVRTLFSDRGTNFTGAANELKEALQELDYKKMHTELLALKCDLVEFKFNSPKASHMGGLWERAIRSLRAVLSAILIQHSSRLNDESFHTFIVETEAISNSKPLTTLDLCDPSSEMPLTPARLLTMKGRTALPPPGKFADKEIYGHRRWRQVQALSNAFWRQWRLELLPTFQARKKWLAEKKELAVDDVVILMDESVPRGQWPLAKVERLITSHDGLVRRVEVKCHDSTYERPVCKLVYLCSAEK